MANGRAHFVVNGSLPLSHLVKAFQCGEEFGCAGDQWRQIGGMRQGHGLAGGGRDLCAVVCPCFHSLPFYLLPEPPGRCRMVPTGRASHAARIVSTDNLNGGQLDQCLQGFHACELFLEVRVVLVRADGVEVLERGVVGVRAGVLPIRRISLIAGRGGLLGLQT